MSIEREALITALQNHCPGDQKEKADLQKIIALITDEPRCFYRDCFPAHVTGSALLLSHDRSHVLMNHHKSLNKWLCFGGHADGEEDMLNVAKRETEEESGITGFTMIGSGIIDVDIHPIPHNPDKNEVAHAHYDIRYIFALNKQQHSVTSDESIDLRWCTYQQAIGLVKESSPSMARLINKASAFIQHSCDQ